MSAYMDLNGSPATRNNWLFDEVLRGTWDFGGVAVSDANAVRNLVTHGFATDLADAAIYVLTAGIDMGMAVNEPAYAHLPRALVAEHDRRGRVLLIAGPARRQPELLEAVVATGTPMVLLVMIGRPLDLRWAAEQVPAILDIFYPGELVRRRRREPTVRCRQARAASSRASGGSPWHPASHGPCGSPSGRPNGAVETRPARRRDRRGTLPRVGR